MTKDKATDKAAIPAILKEAQELAQAGNGPAAETLFKRILKSHPDTLAAWRGYLDLLLSQGDDKKAITLAKRGRTEAPDFATMFATKQATALDRLGRTKAAVSLLDDAHAADPADVPATLLLAHLNFKQQTYDRAAALYREVTEAVPDHLIAWRGRLDVCLQRQDRAEALRLCAQLLLHQPKLAELALAKQAAVLSQLGQRPEAIAILSVLHEQDPSDLQNAALLADSLLKEGRPDRAAALLDGTLETHPHHAASWRQRIKISLDQGQAEQALHLSRTMAEALPGMRIHALMAQADALEMLDRHQDAAQTLTALQQEQPDDPNVALRLARALQKSWQLDGAFAAFQSVIKDDPNHLAAWQGLVGVHLQKGDADAALACCDAGLQTIDPSPDVLLERKGQILRSANRFKEAIEVLIALQRRDPKSEKTALALAQVHLENGSLKAADKVYETCLQFAPGSQDALLGRVSVAEGWGEAARGVSLLTDFVGMDAASWGADTPAAFVLKYCELQIQLSDVADIGAHLTALASRAGDLTGEELLRAFALAERQTLSEPAAGFLQAIALRETLSIEGALILLRHTHAMADLKLTGRLAGQLGQKLPPAQRTEFRVHVAALLEGPAAALDMARRELPTPRVPKDACLIGRYLIDAGRAQAAVRYLHRAARNWAGSRSVRSLFLHACGLAGQHDLLERHLDRVSAEFPSLDLGLEKLKALHSSGKTKQAQIVAEKRRERGLSTLHPRQYLDMCLACGALDKAEAATDALRTNPDSNSRTAAHFSASLQGRMLNDLRLYRRMETYGGATTPPDAEAMGQLIQQYYYPAKAIIDRWMARPAVPRAADIDQTAAIPPLIFQYWNTAKPPDEVAALMEGWRMAEGFEHRLFNHMDAADFLRSEFGPRFAQAFQKARSPAEESDFFRLCCLHKYGGVYVDADDKRVGDLRKFVGLGQGLTVVREPIGAVGNNTIVAPPGHPVLAAGIKFTMRALIANENDGAWFKTGPGMLTRAIALYIHQAPAQQVNNTLTILTGDQARKFIQPHVRLPYKSTVKYWNAKDRKLAKGVLEALGNL